MTRLLLFLLRVYRYAISPMMAQRCIYYPSCSAYAAEALEQHGLWPACGLIIRRLLRCHPFAKGGYDPVPECKCTEHPIAEIKEQQ
ncbi:MAG: membrane protein insertion efficiency factor YidD [Mariprofundaceae bacterium]|nr:membrane protein insertion efficiency factor YidD [Mariprofundaceae bacterium]